MLSPLNNKDDPIKNILNDLWRIGIQFKIMNVYNLDFIYTKQLDLKFKKELFKEIKIMFVELPIHESEISTMTNFVKTNIQDRIIMIIRGELTELLNQQSN